MQRVVGVDLVRGLAVLGMFTAHLGDDRPPFWSPTGWLIAADGRSAATFALLAGVSAALLSGGTHPLQGPFLRHARVRVAVRAAALLPVGIMLIALGTPVVVILPHYAVMFALVTLALRWSRRTLLLAAGVVAVVGPWVWVLVRMGEADGGAPLPLALDVLVGHHYPAVVWMAYLLVGVAVGRTDLRAPGVVRHLAVWGAVAAVTGYGVGAVALRTVEPTHTVRRMLLASYPHSNATPEVVGNLGVTLLLLAGCLLLARTVPRALAPLAATGALALTAYCGHLVVIALLGDVAVWQPSNLRLGAFIVVTLLLTTLWRSLLGRGPLERLMHSLSTAAADGLVPQGSRDRRVSPQPATTSQTRAST